MFTNLCPQVEIRKRRIPNSNHPTNMFVWPYSKDTLWSPLHLPPSSLKAARVAWLASEFIPPEPKPEKENQRPFIAPTARTEGGAAAAACCCRRGRDVLALT